MDTADSLKKQNRSVKISKFMCDKDSCYKSYHRETHAEQHDKRNELKHDFSLEIVVSLSCSFAAENA